MKTKTISILLILALCLSMAIPVMAAEKAVVTVVRTDGEAEKTVEMLEVDGVVSEGSYSLPDNSAVKHRVFYTETPATVTIKQEIEGGDIGAKVQKATFNEDGTFVLDKEPTYVDLKTGEWKKNDKGEPTTLAAGATYVLEEGAYFFEAANASAAFFVAVGKKAPAPATETPQAETPSAWAVEQVKNAVAAGIVPETLQAKYTEATTRAEFCALAVALYEKVKGTEITEREKFSDTTDVNVEKMAALKVVNGVGDSKFAPDNKLTREQAATMLSRLADAIEKPLTKEESKFADNASISAWALEAVGQMQATGVMGGVGENTFSPATDYTREQSIATIMRLFDIVK